VKSGSAKIGEDATITCERLGFKNYTEKAAKPLSYGLIIIL
jgi:hypothetical protein